MVVSVIVVSVLVVLLAVIIHVLRKTVRWLGQPPAPRTAMLGQRPGPLQRGPSSAPAYGHLPTPDDPVGALGSLSPDADLSSRTMSEGDLLGE